MAMKLTLNIAEVIEDWNQRNAGHKPWWIPGCEEMGQKDERCEKNLSWKGYCSMQNRLAGWDVENTPKLYPGPTMQSRPCRQLAGFGLVISKCHENTSNMEKIYANKITAREDWCALYFCLFFYDDFWLGHRRSHWDTILSLSDWQKFKFYVSKRYLGNSV